MSFDDDGLAASLNESSSDDDSADSTKYAKWKLLKSHTRAANVPQITVVRLKLDFWRASIASKWRRAHVLLNTAFCNIFRKFGIAVVSIAVSGSMARSLQCPTVNQIRLN